MRQDKIVIRGAKEHNLKNIDLSIPRNKLVVMTGISGSGKSSLAFDTIYAEGQRRYVESLSSYARQFLGQMDKPDVESIEGLSPAISIDQKTTSRNPRSTVGTVTEIYDYLRLLYARIGIPHCPECGKEISQQTVDQIVDQIMELPNRTRIQVLAPIVRGRKGEYVKLFEDIKKMGFVRVRIDGEIKDIGEDFQLEKNKKHTIEIVVDRLIIKGGIEQRLTDSIETSLAHGNGIVTINIVDGEDIVFSQNFACVDCGISIEELTPRMFSFNSPYGACPKCDGIGVNMEIDVDLVIPDKNKSIIEGGIEPWGRSDGYYMQLLQAAAHQYDISLDKPINKLSSKELDIILYGSKKKFEFNYFNRRNGRLLKYETGFEGVINNLERRYRETTSNHMKEEIEEYMSKKPCPNCNGERLRKESRAVTINGKSISNITEMPIKETVKFFEKIELTQKEKIIARQVLKEINDRLGFMINVGLDYLTLARSAGTLSGGESQRIRLATQIGSQLMGVIYILDEPSIGLHQRDNAKLLKTLQEMRDLGNTLIVVEHDEETICTADHIIDIGPGAGGNGGEIVADGSIEDIMNCKNSITGQYLNGGKQIEIPEKRRLPSENWLEVKGAKQNNLKDIDVRFPLNVFCCVTGVSGSGKSTLVNEILHKGLAGTLHGAKARPGAHSEIIGFEHLDKVISVDQSPIGRTPRSNPATYTGVFDGIRELFSMTPEARMRGYKRGRFSFNLKGGRCEACRGDGIIKIEMHFLPDVYVPCEVCKGKRYNRETLEVKYKGKNISDVLNMTIEEALEFFRNIPATKRRLQTLVDVGLGYMKLGQPSTTLSGGEAQRVKLATELCKRSSGNTLYILDEPTTGLHFADIDKLLKVLNRLVDAGNTVLVIEHNLDVIKVSDYIIDLGPEGGDNGGFVIATGTPEEIIMNGDSYTGQFLKKSLPTGKKSSICM